MAFRRKIFRDLSKGERPILNRHARRPAATERRKITVSCKFTEDDAPAAAAAWTVVIRTVLHAGNAEYEVVD